MEKRPPAKAGEALLEKRLRAVELHLQGVPVMQIVERSGLGWAAVRAAIARHQLGGAAALLAAPTGPQPGSGRKLTPAQEADVRRLIRARAPWFYGLKVSLWTRGAVLDLIRRRCDITLTEHGLGNYLKRWGLVLPAGQEASPPIRAWLDDHVAELRDLARREDAEVYWQHKTPKLDPELWGKLPSPASSLTEESGGISSGSGQRGLVSVSNSQGRLMWMLINSRTFNAKQQQRFLNALARDTKRPLLYLVRHDVSAFTNRNLMNPPGKTVKLFPQIGGGRPAAFAFDVIHPGD